MTRPLSPREQQVAALLAQGLEWREIARRLGVSLGAVQSTINRAVLKLPPTPLRPTVALIVWHETRPR